MRAGPMGCFVSVNIFTGLAQKLTGRREAIVSICVCLGLHEAHTPPTSLICPFSCNCDGRLFGICGA